jgi:hypothetical protein
VIGGGRSPAPFGEVAVIQRLRAVRRQQERNREALSVTTALYRASMGYLSSVPSAIPAPEHHENGRALLSLGAGPLLAAASGIFASGMPAKMIGAVVGVALVGNGVRLLRRPNDGRTALTRRVVDTANRVQACAPEGHRQAPYRLPSAFGLRRDAIAFIEDTQSGAQIARRQGRMTDRLWREVKEVIEELGRAGWRDYSLARYLEWDERPDAMQCTQLTAALIYALADPPMPAFV